MLGRMMKASGKGFAGLAGAAASAASAERQAASANARQSAASAAAAEARRSGLAAALRHLRAFEQGAASAAAAIIDQLHKGEVRLASISRRAPLLSLYLSISSFLVRHPF